MTPLTIAEAYQRVLEAVEEMKAAGIRVDVTPSRSKSTKREDRLPRDQWVDISFHVADAEQAAAVSRKADELGWLGIVFDTGGCKGSRDWQIDWSFGVGDVPDSDQEARRSVVEGLIEGGEDGQTGP